MLLSLALGMGGSTNAAAQSCRQALALGLDVSGSVDQAEYQLQMQGLAGALLDPSVQEALLQTPEIPVYLLVFEWSSAAYQRVLVSWRALSDAAAIEETAQILMHQSARPDPGTTGIGAAMAAAGEYFRQVPSCWRKTLDLSGDGQNNDWPPPETARQSTNLSDVTINGLVIGAAETGGARSGSADFGSLVIYYQSQVIKGPDAFVEIAQGFEDFQAAMTRKLIRELEVLVMGDNTGLPANTAVQRLAQR